MSSELEKNDLMTRRAFTVESVMALLAGVTISVSGCGGSDNPTTAPTSPSPPPTATGDVNGAVSVNHGHIATIQAARLMAGGAITLDITGQANHPHTVALTADEVQRLGARQQVVKTSSSEDLHNHTVTFN